jgi:TRAP-type C4-dicarboxylate transport system permease small subunit
MMAVMKQSSKGIAGWLGKWLNGTVTFADYIAALSISLMMFGISADVIRRSITGRSIGGVLEASEVLLVFVVFLGLGYAQLTGAHVSTSVLTSRMPRLPRRVVQGIGLTVALVFLAWAIYATGFRAWDAYLIREYRFGLLQVPIWPGRIAVVIGFTLWFLEVLRDWILVVIRGQEEPLFSGLEEEDLELLNRSKEGGHNS